MGACEHTVYDWPCQDCVVLTPDQEARGQRLRSIGLTWGIDGKAGFHGQTVRERQEQQLKHAKAAGLNIEPVGTRPYTGR